MIRIKIGISVFLILSIFVSMIPMTGASVLAKDAVQHSNHLSKENSVETLPDEKDVVFTEDKAVVSLPYEPSGSNRESEDSKEALTGVSSGTCGYDLSWVLDDNGILTISGTGNMSKYTYSSRPEWSSQAADIKQVIIESGVTSIAPFAFDGCKTMTSVSIPEGITSIGNRAFLNCEALTTVYIPSTVNKIDYAAFNGCKGLTRVDIIDIDAWSKIVFNDSSVYSNPLANAHELYLNGELVTDVVLSSDVGKLVFTGCTGLKTVTLLDGITAIGNSAFSNCNSLNSVILPETLTSIGSSVFQNCISLNRITLPSDVSKIGLGSFSGCSSLESISIPAGVTTIGSSAFKDCTSLSKVDITDIVKWCNISFGNEYANPLYYAENLYLNGELVTSLKITEGVESILPCAFYNCKNLKTVELSECVKSISAGAFKNCSTLESVTMTDNVVTLDSSAFSNCSSLKNIVLSQGITEIGTSCFAMCTSLQSITFGNKLTEIGIWAFDGCKSLSSVTLPDSVTDLSTYAFRNCTSLKNVVLSRGMTMLVGYVFYGCSSLESVYIPDTITSLGENAFYECSRLKSVNVPGSVETIGEHAFYGCLGMESIVLNEGIKTISSYSFIECRSLTGIYIPDSVTELGVNVFAGCHSLENVHLPEGITSIPKYTFRDCAFKEFTIPDSVTEIGEYAFYSCSLLTDIDMGNNITEIPKNAFGDCDSLKSVKIPASVTAISDLAFTDCDQLESITLLPSVISISANAFSGCEKLTIKCTEASYAESYAIENSIPYKYDISYSGSCGEGVTWYLDCDGIMIISGNGAMTDFKSLADRPWHSYTSNIVKVIVNDGVTNIGNRAFYSAGNLREVILGKDVKVIGEGAFYQCEYLNKINLNEGLERIKSIAFGWCTFMKEVTFPSTLKKIDDNAFYMDKYLTDIVLPEGLTHVGAAAFNGSGIVNITIPSTLVEIDMAAFSRCSKLKNVYISDMSAWLSMSAYSEGANPIEIAENLYLNGELVTDLVVPDDVTKISARSFYNYTHLKSVTIHEKVNLIDNNAFYGCSSLESVYINDMDAWCNISFYGAGAANPLTEAENLYLNGELVTEVVIPRGVEKMGFAFYKYAKLKTITIPPSVIDFYDSCFDGCTDLTIRCRKGSHAETHALRNDIKIEYINYTDVDSYDNLISITELSDVKDVFISFGEYTSYRDTNSNKIVRVTASKLGNAKKYSYNVPYSGRYTVLVRHNDESMEFIYIDVAFTDPEFSANGLRLNITGLEGVKVIRTAYGEYSSASALKKSDTARAFSSKDVLYGVSEYYIQYRYNGSVTVIVSYDSGRSVFYTYNVIQKSPAVEQQGNKLIFSELDDLKVLRYAPGEYTTSTEIKNAAGSIGISPKKIVDGKITVTLVGSGIYTFCVQYNDESHNYYTVTVE